MKPRQRGHRLEFLIKAIIAILIRTAEDNVFKAEKYGRYFSDLKAKSNNEPEQIEFFTIFSLSTQTA